MASGMKLLAKETAIYGLSSIVGKFLNWCLVPMYTRILTTAEFGITTNIYAYVAVLGVILTYGMETGFFRFINKEEEKPSTVYSTTLGSIAITSIIFIVLSFIFLSPVSTAIGYQHNSDFVLIMAIVIAIDAFSSIPFAYLRYKKKAKTFMIIKMSNIFFTIFLNLFFLVVCPQIHKSAYAYTIDWFYDTDYKAGYVFLSNIFGSFFQLVLLSPYYIKNIKLNIDFNLLKRMLKYSMPLLLLGLVGMLNQNIDKIIYPFLFDNREEAMSELGIYGACTRIAVVMMMFTQAFRFAYEPFVFGKKNKNDLQSYSDAMKYFVIFSLIIFLGVMYYIDILKFFVGEEFFAGIRVVPIVMISYIVYGIYFNLSFWYKMADKTYYGAIFSSVGCILTFAINIIFVPRYGYIASAWASLICNVVMMLLSYIFEQREFPIYYEKRRILSYFVIALALYLIGAYVPIENIFLRLSFRTILFFIFLFYIVKKDLPLSELPVIGKHFRK
ncbi:lipopolysaccharide biosynthesis protein [Dysgonomonas sp. 216]|uniref:lipopolysaccharide biosynthesis protein n=1 Tax=Dysgonomonas sp. 216 TaxID=2302934 RepID=UPI0013D2B83A|nr:oligosaccharide flippase family protein [Dysgonomonas sp. 216]NDW17780.1 lipopolysaccharide biosynthesis protein [Dysgonomonas sp. 216]